MSLMPRTYKKAEEWLSERVGKTIFIDRPLCPCSVCESRHKNGYRVEEDKWERNYTIDIAFECDHQFADSPEDFK